MKRNENKKSNKKVLTVAALALLLGFVGYTGGSTYAKYVTSQTHDSGTATVAKWGIVSTVNVANLFGTEYGEVSAELAKVSETETVVSATNAVVAPGTSGYLTLTFNGQPEVNFEVSVGDGANAESFPTVTIAEASALGVTIANDYLPLKWYVEAGAGRIACDGTFADALTKLNDCFKNKVYAAGSTINTEYKLGWEWAFSVDEDTDILDTFLGNQDTRQTVSFDFKVTIEQSQKQPA